MKETTRKDLEATLVDRARRFHRYLCMWPEKAFPDIADKSDNWDFHWSDSIVEGEPHFVRWNAANELEVFTNEYGVIRFKSITVSDVENMVVGPLLTSNEQEGDSAISKIINDGDSPVERTITFTEEDSDEEMHAFAQELNTKAATWFRVGNDESMVSAGAQLEIQINLHWKQQTINTRTRGFIGATKVTVPPRSRAEISIMRNTCDAERTVSLTGRLAYLLEAVSPGNMDLCRTPEEWADIMRGVGIVDKNWADTWKKNATVGGYRERKFIEGSRRIAHNFSGPDIDNYLRYGHMMPTITLVVTRRTKGARAADIAVKTETL